MAISQATPAPIGAPASARIALDGMTPVVHSYVNVNAVGRAAARRIVRPATIARPSTARAGSTGSQRQAAGFPPSLRVGAARRRAKRGAGGRRDTAIAVIAAIAPPK